MLFYVKKYVWLDLLVTLVLAGSAYGGLQYFGVQPAIAFTYLGFAEGLIALGVVTGWTFLVQAGYAVVKGKEFSRALTASLANEYANASLRQAFFGGIAAACGEEFFFRGFIQTTFGLAAGTLLFGLAHFGGKEIRTVSYWAFPQGFWFGLAFLLTGNLLVPMIAHGLFDIGGVLYFRRFMKLAEQTP